MMEQAAHLGIPAARGVSARSAPLKLDVWLLGSAVTLMALGLVMVSSASITMAARELGHPFYYLVRQAAYIGVGLSCAAVVLRVPTVYWERYSLVLILFSVLLLLLVLVPYVGRSVNGSTRWLPSRPSYSLLCIWPAISCDAASRCAPPSVVSCARWCCC